ncbi:hypothetical protein SAMN05192581_101430 [Bacteroides ovatus]|uniref:Uncharacterized protein n=2 Tax=Bacteroides ovatus TaxID=28116 RepID=A0A1G6G6Q6_BACOV|nr:hypothetical protein SAMN05192581_101430 [Bacteroides ovatus]
MSFAIIKCLLRFQHAPLFNQLRSMNTAISYFRESMAAKHYATSILLLIGIVMVTSCSEEKKNHVFRSSDEALTEYRSYLSELKSKKGASIKELTTSIKQWREIDDFVFSFVSKDTIRKAHVYPTSEYKVIHDSIRSEFIRLTSASKRTYKDIVSLKISVSAFADDKKVQEAATAAHSFFSSLDTMSLYKGGKDKMIRGYKEFLDKTQINGIHSKTQFLSYLQVEDILFRSFLCNLSEMNNVSVTYITRSTENICSQVMHSAGSEVLSTEDAVIFMSLRSNRRLLQNAITCTEDIRTNKIRQDEQRTAYFWMILQPFISIDDFGMAILSSEQRKQFEKLAADVPSVISKLSQSLNMNAEVTDNLPNLFLKIYISKL